MRRQFKVPRHRPGVMNKTEQRYADRLEAMKKRGEIESYKFEMVKFKLAKRTFYTPDFYVVLKDHIEIHEVKGFWMDHARVKIKVAAEQFPEFRWISARWKNKTIGWIFEEF